jgi:hypothetical protein
MTAHLYIRLNSVQLHRLFILVVYTPNYICVRSLARHVPLEAHLGFSKISIKSLERRIRKKIQLTLIFIWIAPRKFGDHHWYYKATLIFRFVYISCVSPFQIVFLYHIYKTANLVNR